MRKSHQTSLVVMLTLAATLPLFGSRLLAERGDFYPNLPIGQPPSLNTSSLDPNSAGRYIVTSWDASRGLPLNSVTALIETQDGYLWVGMLGGLARFDGISFTLFNGGKTPGMNGNRINSLFQDRAGALWIGTQEGGLTRLDKGRFTSFTEKDGLPANDVDSLCEGPDATIWMLSANQLVSYKDGTLVTHLSAIPKGVVAHRLCFDHAGALLIGTDAGLIKWDRTFPVNYMIKDGLPANNILDLFTCSEGVLVGTSNGIARLKDGAIDSYPATTGSSAAHVISAATGDIWFSGQKGPVRVLRGGKVIEYGKANPVTGETGKALCEDRQGDIWYGTLDGLYRLRPALFSVPGVEDDGVSVAGITQDAAANIWIAQTCSGLMQIDAKTGERQVFDTQRGLPHECVWSVYADRDGAIWAGTWGGGLVRLKDGKVDIYTAEKNGLSNNTVLSIYRDRAGDLWVGTGSGLNVLQGDRFVVYAERNGLVGHDVRTITEDHQGNLWIGTTSGLSQFKDGRFTNYTVENGLSNDFVRDVFEDTHGALWIATYGGGLNRLKNGVITKCNSSSGLPDDFVSRILEDDEGNFWISSNRGVFRVNEDDLNGVADGKSSLVNATLYGAGDGMTSSECNGGAQPAGWKTADGSLWFPTVRGAVRINPKEANARRSPPLVAIEDIQLDHRSLDINAAATVPPGKGDLEIRYTGLDLGAPEKIRFRYKLDGYDDGWTNAGPNRIAYYTKIPPGKYTFRVMAVGENGTDQAEGAYTFRLQAHFYQTIWFYSLAGLAIALSGFALFKLRVGALQRRARELQATVTQRTAEIASQKNSVAEAYQQLERTNAQVVRANDDMLSVLNKLRLGVLLIDDGGKLLFLSETAERLTGAGQTESMGKRWDEVLALGGKERQALLDLIASPQTHRGKLPLQLSTASGKYWAEIDVRDDPRGEGKKIIFLYDVSEVYDLRSQLGSKPEFKGLVGQGAAMQLVFKQIRDVSKFDTTVLIEGETGTGKELVARAIHLSSARKDKPYIPVNCGGLTESVLASQLFGHRRGAFTGAVADHVGLFEAANGGTIFLDEIGDIPLSVQTSLLRVLQEKEITRLGDSKPRKIDARIVCATHRDLAKAVEAGLFREDLLYRIRVARIQLPPLRKRPEDIPLLASTFLNQYRGSSSKPVQDISSEAMSVLLGHGWPGNVRELKSAIEYAVIHSSGPLIKADDLPAEVDDYSTGAEAPATGHFDRTADGPDRLLQALKDANGNRSAAARLLGMSRATFYRKVAAMDIKLEKER